MVVVMLLADKHTVTTPKYYYSRACTLPYATNSALTISNTAIHLLKDIMADADNTIFKKAGVIVTELIPQDTKQFNLFTDEDPRHNALMKAMDHLNAKNGTRIVRLATQAQKTWDMKQNLRSPRYTTDFNDILTVLCH